MTWLVHPLPTQEHPRLDDPDEAGFGTLATARGNLPLDELTVRAAITGLVAAVDVVQGFRNVFEEPLEATYVFPLPDRAAVTGLRMEADGHTVVAELKERGRARADYDAALAAGRRASIAEEERPDVFTLRVGNILPGERVLIRLSLLQPLPYADGAAEFRFPLVVAPRYIPGAPVSGTPVGTGWAPDTDAVPDASRITPPVLLPGLPDPVPLSVVIDVDPAGLPLTQVRSSLHTVVEDPSPVAGASPAGGPGTTRRRRLRIEPGERADRDVVLRLHYGTEQAAATAAVLGDDGTFRVTVLPPTGLPAARPRDVVLLLDRSGSMAGWKMVAARRAAARIVDTLSDADRFTVLGFDDQVEGPAHLPAGLVPATDRNRYRAVEHLARLDARGGTELLAPLLRAIDLLTGGTEPRDRVLVLVTDGQVGNEDQILHEVTAGLASVRVHVVGIDEAVNAGFLARLAVVGGGRCELVESEDRLDEAAEQIHRRITAPLLTGLAVDVPGADPATLSPRRLPPLFPGVPLVVTGRLAGPDAVGQAPSPEAPVGGTPGTATAGDDPTTAGSDPAAGQDGPTPAEKGPDLAIQVRATAPDGSPWTVTPVAQRVTGDRARALTATWARSHLRDLEDARAAKPYAPEPREQAIVATSLRYGVLCRFTAFVAVDERVVTDGGTPHRVTQPVEPVRGWDLLRDEAGQFGAGPARTMALMSFPASGPAAPAPLPPGFVGARFTPPAPPSAAPRAAAAGFARAVAAGPLFRSRRQGSLTGRPPAGPHAAEPTEIGPGFPSPNRPGPNHSSPNRPGPHHPGPGGIVPETEETPEPSAAQALISELRDRLRTECDRLRAAVRFSESDRIRVLGDLGTRLGVLVAELQALAAELQPEDVDPDLVARLARLLPGLHACDRGDGPHGPAFEALWQETVDELDALSRERRPGRSGPGTRPDGR